MHRNAVVVHNRGRILTNVRQLPKGRTASARTCLPDVLAYAACSRGEVWAFFD